ncbi:MAG: hypothetical protein EAZ92_01425 [Candidatus Kapaibacterium sp.]|nr:MAG: hypothetical protein EAZ92_01425 [Candidatus Kapabacteria bacterium]
MFSKPVCTSFPDLYPFAFILLPFIMTLLPSDIANYAWKGAWTAISNDVERQFLESELMTSLQEGHPLYKRPLMALAERDGGEWVLFLVRWSVSERMLAEVSFAQPMSFTVEEPHSRLFVSMEEWENAVAN